MKVDVDKIRDDPALRRGVYGLNEVTRYLSLGQDKALAPSAVARWAQQGLTALEHTPRRSDYSFADLISMLVVRNLVQLGLTLPAIRDAEMFLRQRYGHAHPFVNVRLKTAAADVFYDALPAVADQLTAANRGGQEVLRPAITLALRGVTYERSVAAEWSPAEGVVLNPRIQFGEPCIAETGVTTRQVTELARATPLNEVARVYRVDELSVRRAVDFEEHLAAAA